MKVAFFLPHLTDGGVAHSSFILAEQFVAHGHEVDILTIRPNPAMTGEPPAGARVIDLGAGRAATAIPALARYLRREKPSGMISVQHFANTTAVLAKVLAWSRTKLVLSERMFVDAALERDKGIRRLVLPRLMWLLYRKANAVVANSSANADRLGELLGWERGRVRTIYNPTFHPSISGLAEEPLDDPWFAPGEPPVVLTVGRLSVEKDYGVLVRAFAKIKQTVDCRLVIVGEGPERASLEALVRELGVADEVDLPGHRANPYSYMSRAALFVLSSQYEGLPNVLIEAQACGVPVLSTDCPTGPREILMDGAAGVLVPVGDVGALADQATRLLNDRSLAQGLADEATSHLSRFDPETCYQAYLGLLEG